MPLDLLSVFLGFVLGTAAVGFAWHLTSRTVRNPETAKLTALWSIKDLVGPGERPALVAQRLDGIHLPPGSKVLVPAGSLDAVPQEILSTCDVRMHPDVRLNAALGRDRALVFSGPVSPRSYALFTMEPDTIRRLQADFTRWWNASTPHVETVPLQDLGGKEGRLVDVTGRASELMEYRGRKMLRLMDGKAAIGVITNQEDVASYQGGIIRVVGRIRRDGGYPYLEAERVQLVSEAPVAV